jgi:hypothetical protein
MWMAAYVAASCVVALVCLRRLEETAGKHLAITPLISVAVDPARLAGHRRP